MKGKLSITRPSYPDNRELISIKVVDGLSKVTFLEIEIDLDNFTRCLTGLNRIDCDINVRDLGYVGKKRETREIEFKLSKKTNYANARLKAIIIAKQHTPEGWIASEYYGSQNSFFNINNEYWARTIITRWIDTDG